MTEDKQSLEECLHELVSANQILANENVVDAFGHISARHPHNPERFLLARSRSPQLVETGDIQEFDLEGKLIGDDERNAYIERYIHAAIYAARADVASVVHAHPDEVIPFSVSAIPMRAVVHSGAVIGTKVPNWDLRDKFGELVQLVVDMEQGRDLAETLGDGRVVLMRGHGLVIAAPSVKAAVMVSIYTKVNARLQLEALRLGADIVYQSDTEIEKHGAVMISPFSIARAWEYWKTRAEAL